MTLTTEQIKNLKEQLKSQVQHLPEPQKQEALNQINSLSPQALELMLKQQKGKGGEEKVFRLIVQGKIPSTKVEEDSNAIAVLEINPISIGHTLIIQKKPAKTEKAITKETKDFAESISKKLIQKLKAKSAEIQAETKFGETIINIIPIYDKPLNLESPRKQASKEELKETISTINLIIKPKPEIIKIEKKSRDENQVLKLKRKIP